MVTVGEIASISLKLSWPTSFRTLSFEARLRMALTDTYSSLWCCSLGGGGGIGALSALVFGLPIFVFGLLYFSVRTDVQDVVYNHRGLRVGPIWDMISIW